MSKDRNQRLATGDTVRLKLNVFNAGGDFANVHEIDSVKIYKLFSETRTEDNPFGRTLVETIAGSSITNNETGKYYIDLELDYPQYTQGKYHDEWNIIFEPDTEIKNYDMYFNISGNTWFVDSMPIVHDFSFKFNPNKIVKGSKKFIEIQVVPNVPRGTDKQRYYENAISNGSLHVSIEQTCGPCVPTEKDLRLIVDKEEVEERDGCFGYYYLNTEDMDCGIYHIWFQMNLGPNVYISEKQPLQIFH